MHKSIELSIVLPCLRETETLAYCIESAKAAFAQHNICGEVLVANNGGEDECYEIAQNLADKVILVHELGYGKAVIEGISQASSNYVIFADADGSYDFAEINKFYKKLEDGYDLVMGCRLPIGGGVILEGAMPFLHKWLGSPLFTFIARKCFGMPVHDVNCGMRALRRDFFMQLDLQSYGMEFASEMIIKTFYAGGKISEVPITLHPDKRVKTTRHLRTFRDGLRHLRVYLTMFRLTD